MSSSPKLNILIAYPYLDEGIKNLLKKNSEDITFLLDSGAFTSWKAGTSIDLDQYVQFLETLKADGIIPWRYFTLDVIGDPEKTLKNYQDLLDRGYKPVPIFTRGENFSTLEKFYETSDVVAIGGLVQTKQNRGFVKRIMREIKGRPVHWLGFTEGNYISIYKPYSADSSSWAGAVRYGGLKIYTRGGRFIVVRREHFIKRPDPELVKIFEEYGEDLTLFKNRKEWANSGKGKYLLERMTCKSWVRFAMDIEKTFGTKFFLACASKWQIEMMLWAFNYWRSYHEMRNDTFRRDGLNNPPLSSLGTRA